MNLTTIKIQNWDRTITTIPTSAFISESFKNWKGMFDSGCRRIKRHINIDTTSIKFCSEEMLDKLEKIDILSEYIKERRNEITKFNIEKRAKETSILNGRGLTNIGVFRKYIHNYLFENINIDNSMTVMSRQLQSTEYGLPLEIYAFTNDTRWEYYEDIQSDIFDHLYAVMAEFELRTFQNPNGNDLKNLINK